MAQTGASQTPTGPRLKTGNRWLVTLSVLILFGAGLGLHQLGATTATLAAVLVVAVVIAALRFRRVIGVLYGVLGVIVVWVISLELSVETLRTGVEPLSAGQVEVAAVWSFVLVLVPWVVGGFVRAVDLAHQRDLTSWWDAELGFGGRIADQPTMLSDDRVRLMVSSGDFYPVYQPIYGLVDGKLVAAEALTRFDSEPPVPPSQWFAKAAQLGLGTELEIAAIEKGVASAGRLPAHVWVTVNASATTLGQPQLKSIVRNSPRTVLLELTELEPVLDYQQLFGAVTALRESGAKIAIDNVGASLTSLKHVARMAPDVVKIDGTLTNDARGDEVRWSLTKRLLRYAHSSGAMIVAEGIEDPEDLETWRELGAFAAQGYLLGRPGPITFAEQVVFPAVTRRQARRAERERKKIRHPRDAAGVEAELASSQLGEETFWGRGTA